MVILTATKSGRRKGRSPPSSDGEDEDGSEELSQPVRGKTGKRAKRIVESDDE